MMKKEHGGGGGGGIGRTTVRKRVLRNERSQSPDDRNENKKLKG